MPNPVARVLADLAGALDSLGARWYVFGAQAAIAYGHARLTADVDVTVDVGERPTRDLIAALTAHGIEPRFPLDRAFIDRTRVLPLVHRASQLDVDVVLAGPGPEQTFLDRSVRVRVGRRKFPFVSPTDLVVLKILAGRPKDREDVAGLLRAPPAGLDLDAARMLLRELESALDQSDLVPALDEIVARSKRRRSRDRP